MAVRIADMAARDRPRERLARVGLAGLSDAELIALVVPRDLIAAVLRHDGIGFAVAHTHPSGDPRPSPEDVAATQALAEATRTVGLRFLDHVVLAGDTHRSLRDLGHLP